MAMQGSLADMFVRFEEQVHALALDMVRTIVHQELERRLGDLRRSMGSSPRRARRIVKPAKPVKLVKPTLEVAPTVVEKPIVVAKKGWTRDAIVSELSTWLVSGTPVDASFITRHGPRGLVAAARKTFGRFEAALNVASLQVSKMYPDGPPSRRGE